MCAVFLRKGVITTVLLIFVAFVLQLLYNILISDLQFVNEYLALKPPNLILRKENLKAEDPEDNFLTNDSLIICDQLPSIKILRTIGEGAVKKVYLGFWKDKYVAVSKPNDADGEVLFEKDFKHGLQMFVNLGPFKRITQLIGYCMNPLTIVTQYHKFGSLSLFRQVLESDTYSNFNTLKTRFQLCLDYVEILMFLHSSPIGVRVMCDSSDLHKTLQQYLLTDDFRIVINDLDALPQVNHSNNKLIKCGHRQLDGLFVAPEQRWPYDNIPFDDSLMDPYDEKTDIWKVPDVCQAFIYDLSDDVVLFHLFSIHKKCKMIDPKKRPSAKEIFNVYQSVFNELFNQSEEH